MEKVIVRNANSKETTITLPAAREAGVGSIFIITAGDDAVVQASDGHSYKLPYGTSLKFPVTGFWNRARAWWYRTS